MVNLLRLAVKNLGNNLLDFVQLHGKFLPGWILRGKKFLPVPVSGLHFFSQRDKFPFPGCLSLLFMFYYFVHWIFLPILNLCFYSLTPVRFSGTKVQIYYSEVCGSSAELSQLLYISILFKRFYFIVNHACNKNWIFNANILE